MEKSSLENGLDTGKDEGYDAVVVGSGYGGSVAACRMSIAGFNVCLMEKGRRWEAQDFSNDTFKIGSTLRFEDYNLGLKFGAKDALFQVYQQDDSLAAVACGLGGGSLVNAGVMASPTVRARRDPRWLKAWEKDWESCEALASEMLKIQTIPIKFQNAKIMEQVVEEDYDNAKNSVKLSVNFRGKDESLETGSCIACGNCLAGCPYNAKNSTDKTYLLSAVQAGCTIITEREVQYVVRNVDEGRLKSRSRRRWLVCFNELDYVAADVVVLSAGVFGTAKILFHSQLRGLTVSQKLGSGLSCNGNNVAYVSGSSVPLNASGLSKKQFSKTPFQERPGPSISSSYTSSLGITIQSAVMPAAYPRFLFKGLTYQWQYDCWFFHDIIDRVKRFMGFKCGQEMVLNAMGYDNCDGKLTYDKLADRVLFQPPHDLLLPRKIEAFQKLAKKVGGVLFMSRYRSTSVHLLGGCIASTDVASGVCNSDGQVFDSMPKNDVHPGLYLCDASIIPCSVGINPCLTIATAAEHVSKRLLLEANVCLGNSVTRHGNKKSGSIHCGKMKSNDSELIAKETMRGQVGGIPCAAYLRIRFKDCDKSTALETLHPLLQGEVGGHVTCTAIEIDRMYVIRGEVDLCKTDDKTPYTQYMHYHLLLAASSGSRYLLEGKKTMNPYLLALFSWSESTTLNVTLRKITDNVLGHETLSLKGKLHISPLELLKTIWSLEGGSKIRFICSFIQSLLRTYILQDPRGRQDFTLKELECGPYPSSIFHEIKTDDGHSISCQQFNSCESSAAVEQDKKLHPVLLINGYSGESYSLPTEHDDLLRTLLKEGHDVWLLNSRVHPSHSLNCFSIEDIGRFDIAAGIGKIIEFYGEGTKVHAVGHCIGGLALHIALMGNHVSAKKIASLSCTNSSMFFKLTRSSLVKMWLPLIPMSMGILGKNKILPMIQESASTTSFRHSLLKSIARLIPRYERCTCDECEVFSGIFGNSFWHENVSRTMHDWLNKVCVRSLPMAGFPHLRKICNAGFIVDAEGRNRYLIHPERMAVPTLYVSGGRTVLVTPETTLLASKYMKLHQPSLRHERVVIDGFGHSDLLIGEDSSELVFPHIVNHIRLAEKEEKTSDSLMQTKHPRQAWTNYEFEDAMERNGSWMLSVITFLLFLVVLIFHFTNF